MGGSDSTGYLNSARAIAAGTLVEPLDALARLALPAERAHLVIPLGYVPGPRPATMASFYPVGLPLHEVAFAKLAGWEWGPFLVSPLAALMSILLVYAVARELGVSAAASLAAAALFAALPVLTFQAVQLMSDTLAAAWALAAVYFALRSRRHAGWAAAAGLAFGVGVLVRPASIVLVLPLLFALAPTARAWVSFVAGGLPAAAVFLGFNRASYGDMWKTGYATGGALADFAFANFPPRFRHYGYWILAMSGPILPAAWISFVFDRARGRRDRLLLGSWFGVFFLLYCFYGPYETWWYTRYLLPGVPALFIASAMLGEDLIAAARKRSARAFRFATAVVVVSILFAAFLGLRLGHRFAVRDVASGQSVFPEAIAWASTRVPERSVLLAMEFSGALKAYGGGPFIRWDWIDGDFSPVRARVEGAGYRIYALLFPHEVREASPRLPGTRWTYLGSHREASLWRLEPDR